MKRNSKVLMLVVAVWFIGVLYYLYKIDKKVRAFGLMQSQLFFTN